MSETWYSADHHFGHRGIIDHCLTSMPKGARRPITADPVCRVY